MSWTPATPCGSECLELYTAIRARMLGKQPTSVSHKGRSVSYADTPLEKLIGFYNQMRAGCAEAEANLPAISSDPYAGQRGRALKPRFT